MDKHSPVLCGAKYAKYQPCNDYTYSKYWRDASQHYVNVPNLFRHRKNPTGRRPNSNYSVRSSSFSRVNCYDAESQCDIHPQSNISLITEKSDASTQTTEELFEELTSSYQNFSQGSQTENSSVTTSIQTDLYIPPFMDIPPPPPIEEVLGVAEIDKEQASETHNRVDVSHTDDYVKVDPLMVSNIADGVKVKRIRPNDPSNSMSISNLPQFIRGAVYKYTRPSSTMSKVPFQNSPGLSSFPHWN